MIACFWGAGGASDVTFPDAPCRAASLSDRRLDQPPAVEQDPVGILRRGLASELEQQTAQAIWRGACIDALEPLACEREHPLHPAILLGVLGVGPLDRVAL